MSGNKGTKVAAFLVEVTPADLKEFAGGGRGPEEVERNGGANETKQWAKKKTGLIASNVR